MRIHTIDLAIVALCALALAACGREPSPEQQAEAAKADVQATVDRLANLPSDPEQAAAELQAMGKDLEKRMAAAKAAEQPAVADACAFFDEADIHALVGDPYSLEPMPRIGSSWGGCNLGPEELTMENMRSARHLMVNLRPAGEFKATLDYHARSGSVTRVDGLAGDAWVDGKALLWQPPGKPWFVFVSGGALGAQDAAFAIEAARRMAF